MGSLAALQTYWTSEPVLAILAAFAILGVALGASFHLARGRSRLRLGVLRASSWLLVAFWTFVAVSLLVCVALADPVEHEVATAKAVAVVSITLALSIASLTAFAVARGVHARAHRLPLGTSLSPGHPTHERATRLAGQVGLASVRVRLVPGAPVAAAEPPDTLVLSNGLLEVLTEEEVDAVLLHELGHLAEADGVDKAFLGAMRRILFLDPFLRALHRASHHEREFRADELAAERMSGGPLASALRKLAPRGTDRFPAGALWHPRLEDRVARLRPPT